MKNTGGGMRVAVKGHSKPCGSFGATYKSLNKLLAWFVYSPQVKGTRQLLVAAETIPLYCTRADE